jgi:hypothetical protein
VFYFLPFFLGVFIFDAGFFVAGFAFLAGVVFLGAAIFAAGDFPFGEGLFPFALAFCDKATNLSTVQLTFSKAQNIVPHF